MFSARVRAAAAAFLVATIGVQAPAQAAFLFWVTPNFAGQPVKGDEPGMGMPLPGATAAELQAHMIWNMRAGLNVAALQCQFAPALMTVRNYNVMLNQHASELNAAYAALTAYFKKHGGKWQNELDSYTTKTYNGFSTLHAQLGFCETAGAIGREVIGARPGSGKLGDIALRRMREFRNSLVPTGDALFSPRYIAFVPTLPPLAANCWTKDDQPKASCGPDDGDGSTKKKKKKGLFG